MDVFYDNFENRVIDVYCCLFYYIVVFFRTWSTFPVLIKENETTKNSLRICRREE